MQEPEATSSRQISRPLSTKLRLLIARSDVADAEIVMDFGTSASASGLEIVTVGPTAGAGAVGAEVTAAD